MTAKPQTLLLALVLLASLASGPVWAEDPVPSRSTADLAAWLDTVFEDRWKADGVTATYIDDATFYRRAALDLTGTIPSVAQVRDFLDDTNERKREYLVDKLLNENRSSQHFARVWRRTLVPGNTPQANAATALEPWLVQQFNSNVAYDEFARRLATARPPQGNNNTDPSPMMYYQAVGGTPDAIASSMTRVFLGVRIGCAKCHNHPFAEWKQSDFWGMAAFFAGFSMQPGQNQVQETRLLKIKAENSTTEFDARVLFGDTPKVPDDKTPRQVFGEWLTDEANPNFSQTGVNRVWQQLCGQGLIPAVDDLDQAHPDDRKVVLEPLAEHFEQAKFDLKWLVGGIVKSKVYQRTCEGPKGDPTPLSPKRPLKTLMPEQVFDSLEQALMLPISRVDDSPRYNGQRAQIIARMNEAYADNPDQFKGGIPQALLLMNGQIISKATSLEESRTLRAVVEAPFLKPEEKIETLYLAAFTRKPTDDELQELVAHVQSQAKGEQAQAYGEIFWALLNSAEFVLSR